MKRVLFFLLMLCVPGMAVAAPAAPVLTYDVSGVDLTASWTDVPGATGYTLYYAPAPFAGMDTVQSMPWDDTSLSLRLWQGASFLFAVTVTDDTGTSGYSNIGEFTMGAPNPVAGDVDGDGKVYLFASDSSTTALDMVYGSAYAGVDSWGSGSIVGASTSDAYFSPVIHVDNSTAPAWGGFGPLAVVGFNAGSFTPYTALHFKFKSNSDTAVNIKFPMAAVQEEIIYNVAGATDLGNGWYDFTIRLANHGDLSACTEFAFLATGDFFLTDIYFDDVPFDQTAGDIDGDGSFFLKSGDGNREIDLRYGTEYADISVWSSGTVIADVVDADYGNAWQLTPGGDWGRSAAAIAFVGFAQGAFSDYTTMTFKFNPGGMYDAINVKFPGATVAEEIVYDLATFGTALDNGWYEVSLPISGHGDVSLTQEFAILTDGTSNFTVTDISFQ